jgi:hypothetical protein
LGINIDIFPLVACEKYGKDAAHARKLLRLQTLLFVDSSDGGNMKRFVKRVMRLASPFGKQFLPNKMLSLLSEMKDGGDIANIFGTTPQILSDILIILSNYRNLCAHEDIVYEHKTERVVPDTKYHELMEIPKMDGEYIYGKNDVFAVIIIFKILLDKKDFRLMMKEMEYEIELLDGKVDSISINKVLDKMGFPHNYIEIIGR